MKSTQPAACCLTGWPGSLTDVKDFLQKASGCVWRRIGQSSWRALHVARTCSIRVISQLSGENRNTRKASLPRSTCKANMGAPLTATRHRHREPPEET